MSTSEVLSSSEKKISGETSGTNRIYEGIVRGDHSATVGVYGEGDITGIHIHYYRWNAQNAVKPMQVGDNENNTDSTVWEVFVSSEGEVYGLKGARQPEHAKHWELLTDNDAQALAVASEFVDDGFIEYKDGTSSRPRPVLCPLDGIAELQPILPEEFPLKQPA